MKDLSFTYRTADAHPLYVHGWAPEEGEPRAVLQILHGMAEHAGRYARLAETFTANGFVVYGHDHRGHGRSVPPVSPTATSPIRTASGRWSATRTP